MSRARHTRHADGFTLMEILIVVAIIGILAGLLFPVFGVLREKAWATRTRNIAVQVSQSWAAHRLDFRAYPITLIAALPDAKADNGDLMFPMTREACNLLNWYGDKDSDFAGSGTSRKTEAELNEEWYGLLRAKFEAAPNYATTRPERVTVKLSATQTESEKPKDVSVFLREKYFARNEVQWREGLKGEKDNRRIWAKLDTNYDGVVSFTSRDAAGKTVTETIRKVAIAWGEDPSGKNPVVKAW